MTFPILASLLVRLVVLLPFQLLRLSLATPSRWTPLALSVFLHCVVRSEERFSRNAETELVCRLLLEKMNLAAEGCKTNDSHADCYQYFCVPVFRTPTRSTLFPYTTLFRSLGFLAGQIGRLITISTTPVIAGDSFEMDAVGALRLSPLRR